MEATVSCLIRPSEKLLSIFIFGIKDRPFTVADRSSLRRAAFKEKKARIANNSGTFSRHMNILTRLRWAWVKRSCSGCGWRRSWLTCESLPRRGFGKNDEGTLLVGTEIITRGWKCFRVKKILATLGTEILRVVEKCRAHHFTKITTLRILRELPFLKNLAAFPLTHRSEFTLLGRWSDNAMSYQAGVTVSKFQNNKAASIWNRMSALKKATDWAAERH